MGDIKAIGSITGYISPMATLKGSLSGVSTTPQHEIYTGTYNVSPKPFETQVLETSNKLLTDDIVVTEIPFHETTNPSNGLTVYIGG